MKLSGRYYKADKETSEKEDLEQEMLQEVEDQRIYLRNYVKNIDNSLGMKLSSEVKKSMINFLVEQL